MAQTQRCPHCGNTNQPSLRSGSEPEDCLYCGERIIWTDRDGWVAAPAGAYRPMSTDQAAAVIGRYPAGQSFSIGADNTAELVEAYLVLAGAPLSAIHKMREDLLGAGANE
jgi:hypothetical protein